VPIKLVFEVSNRLVLDGCIPPHAMPHDRSIVVVAPQKVLKITAPDSIRHSLWLTGLQYLVDSTKKVNNADWPDVLAARLASLNPLLDANNERPVPVKLPVTVPSRDTALKSPFFVTEKPLPPSPPRLETASTMMIMTPPVVPRFSHHAQQPSEGVSSSVAESEGFVAEGAATSKRSESFKSKHVEPYTPSDQKHTPNTHTEEDPAPADDPSDELAVDQMEMLVDRLADI
jgi:Meiotic cell cortex C-terminal pleckstrin homology